MSFDGPGTVMWLVFLYTLLGICALSRERRRKYLIALLAGAATGVLSAFGIGGGSLLLIPMCCALFGITNDIAMQVVGIGFIIGVIQDSCETGLNSSSDVVFTATAEYRQLIKEGKEVRLGRDAYSADELA